MGTGIDTARKFRNIHAYPLMQTKTDLVDFIKGNYQLNRDQLYHINSNMSIDPVDDETKAAELKAAFNRYKSHNESFMKTRKLVPDSLLQRFTSY